MYRQSLPGMALLPLHAGPHRCGAGQGFPYDHRALREQDASGPQMCIFKAKSALGFAPLELSCLGSKSLCRKWPKVAQSSTKVRMIGSWSMNNLPALPKQTTASWETFYTPVPANRCSSVPIGRRLEEVGSGTAGWSAADDPEHLEGEGWGWVGLLDDSIVAGVSSFFQTWELEPMKVDETGPT